VEADIQASCVRTAL